MSGLPEVCGGTNICSQSSCMESMALFFEWSRHLTSQKLKTSRTILSLSVTWREAAVTLSSCARKLVLGITEITHPKPGWKKCSSFESSLIVSGSHWEQSNVRMIRRNWIINPPRERPRRDTQKQSGKMTSQADPASVNFLPTAH